MKKKYIPFSLFILTAITTNGKWPETAATIGVEQLEQDEDGVYLLPDHVNSIESKLTESKSALTSLAADLQAAQTALTAANNDKAAVEQQLATANAAKTQLETELNTAKNTVSENAEKITALEQKLLNRADADPIHTTGNEGGSKGKAAEYSWTKTFLKINK